ncbi:MAG: hypothetical protein GKS04_02050 [Candidatus Mycalebacterium zealandia]|nr:MAG: hypothetical protein GKS04_02050 [Candidatus Mycalebacterium zealandia]
MVFAFVFAGSLAGSSAMPCPMSGGAEHTGHSSAADCPGHNSRQDCGHVSFADCLNTQQSSVENKQSGKTKHLLENTPRFVFYKLTDTEIKTAPRAVTQNRHRPIFLLTKHILV